MVYAIATPEVFQSQNSDTHIVFGEMQVEDMAARAQQAAMEQQLAADAEKTEEGAEVEAAVEEEDDEEVDATGVEEKDIELVVSQANVSRAKAVKALKNSENDVVNAIMVSLDRLSIYGSFFLYINLSLNLIGTHHVN
jgi:nascent polypeptide-associated complex subunit alpha